MPTSSQEAHRGIWLEVAEIRYGTGEPGGCEVQLKGDRERPEAVWWPVSPISGKDDFETFKTITEQHDKKRLVLAWLAYDAAKTQLVCKALRFQSPEPGSR